jgi:hypothetical protein
MQAMTPSAWELGKNYWLRAITRALSRLLNETLTPFPRLLQHKTQIVDFSIAGPKLAHPQGASGRNLIDDQ